MEDRLEEKCIQFGHSTPRHRVRRILAFMFTVLDFLNIVILPAYGGGLKGIERGINCESRI